MFNFEFKNNIQLLRAISVILVFFYHLNLEFFEKGYLGVDIFFVISGYVITQSIIFNYFETKKIDVILFFKKRILRIIPNLFFILTLTFLFFKFYGPSNVSLFNDYLFSLLGISNLYFLFSNQGYFYNIFDNPFAHTWSLGVEEQFYLIYPILIYFIFFNKNKLNFNLRNFKIFIFFLVILSLFFSLYYFNKNPDLSFYFSPLRFWELGFGCFLFMIDKKIPKNQLLTNLYFIILLLIVLINHNLPYLINNILVVIFSGLFITTGKYEFFLNNNFTLNLGRISYSFYLWHLPVIFFINLYVSDMFNQILFSFTISFALSYLTYNFVEKVFIKFNQSFNKIFLFIFPVILVLSISGIYLKFTNNTFKEILRNFIFEKNYLEKKYNWKNRVTFQSIFIKNNEIHDYCDKYENIKNETELNINCLKKINNKYLIFIEGDSHTAQFINPINENSDIKNLYFRFSPQNYISINLLSKLSSEYENIFYLRDINNLKIIEDIEKSKIFKNDKIKFIFFNSTPFVDEKINVQRCLSQQTNCFLDKSLDYKKRGLKQLNKELIDLSNKYDKVLLFDSYNTICPMEKCPIYDKKRDILYFMDNTHLSIEGSNQLKENIRIFFRDQINIDRFN